MSITNVANVVGVFLSFADRLHYKVPNKLTVPGGGGT